jgi:trans-2,3-dihydro-3-hydroxyanthranilate isomerase
LPYRYAILDVFTDVPLAGNPLAVVPDAAGLDDAGMQAIAAEFNLSETVFILPAANPVHSAAVRIFTPRRELSFAGHPTVGTAVYVATERLKSGTGLAESVVILEEGIGPVRCGVYLDAAGNAKGHAIFDLPRLPEPVPVSFDREAVALALGLMPVEIGFENHQPAAYSAGLATAFVPVRGLDVIGGAKIDRGAWESAFGQLPAFLYCRQTVAADRQFHARMFAPNFGIAEDPATGSAAAAFAAVVKRFDEPNAGGHRYVIEQGFEMGRPSLMMLEVDVEGGEIAAARVGGDAVVVAEGVLKI